MVEESTPVDISPLLYLLYTSSKLPQKVRQRATTNPNCTPNILGLMDEKASRASMLLCKRPSTDIYVNAHSEKHIYCCSWERTRRPMQVHKGSARPLQKGRNAIGNGQEV